MADGDIAASLVKMVTKTAADPSADHLRRPRLESLVTRPREATVANTTPGWILGEAQQGGRGRGAPGRGFGGSRGFRGRQAPYRGESVKRNLKKEVISKKEVDRLLCSSALVLIDTDTQNVNIPSFITYECIVVCSPVMSYRSLICISFKLTVHVKGKKNDRKNYKKIK